MAQRPGCLWEPPVHSSPLGRLHSHVCVPPPGQAARIPRSICLLSCRGNRAQQMGPSLSPSGACLPPEPASRLLAFTALPRSLRAGLALPSPNAVHCSVPAKHRALPRWAGTAVLPASCLRHCSFPARGPGEVPTPPAHSPGPGRAEEGQSPQHHLTSDSSQP